jgi:Transposase DDE domain
MPLSFWTAILLVLGQHFEQKHAAWIRWKQFRLLALDGTTINMPAWGTLRSHFGVAKNGKSKGRTQARMLMLQLPLVRMPWRYTVGPVGKGERTMAAELLRFLRADDLVLLDRGFWSYGLFYQIQNQGAYFAIRLSAGVKLKTVRRLGPQDRLVRWKMPTGPRWRDSGLPNQIELRVVDYKVRGFRPSAVVTNVLNTRAVSREDWVRLANETEAGDDRLGVGLYHRRWEIETSFFELKVTQGMEGGLRSRTHQGVYYEIAGHVLLYLLVRWLMVEAAVVAGLDPLRLSFKGALEELQDMRPALIVATPQRVRNVLLPRLLERIVQHQVPLRPGRHYPRPHDTKTKNCGRGKHKRPHKLKQAA